MVIVLVVFPSILNMQGSRSHRLGARSKYIDVMNKGGTGSSAAVNVPPPPGPPFMGGAPNATSQPFTGTFFIPAPVEGLWGCIVLTGFLTDAYTLNCGVEIQPWHSWCVCVCMCVCVYVFLITDARSYSKVNGVGVLVHPFRCPAHCLGTVKNRCKHSIKYQLPYFLVVKHGCLYPHKKEMDAYI